MTDKKNKDLPCFGLIDSVFPETKTGLRNTPKSCFACSHRIECLKTAMKGSGGLKVREEMVDRAYHSGVIGFIDRWSSKKHIRHKIAMGKKGGGAWQNLLSKILR